MSRECINKYLFESLFSVLLGVNPEVEILGYRAVLCLTFEGTAMLFSTAAMDMDSRFSASLATLGIFCFVDYSHPIGCEMVSHCSFDVHFRSDQ